MVDGTQLIHRLDWLVGLRWIAAATVPIAAGFCYYVLGYEIALVPLQILGLVIAGYNLGFRAYVRRLRRAGEPGTPQGLALCTNAQISFDLIALALVIHFTGGVDSPLVFFCVFHMIIASMILSPQAAYAQATLAIALYAVVVLLESESLIHHYHIGLAAASDAYEPATICPALLVVAATLYVATYLACTIVGELRRREQDLARLSEELGLQANACRTAYSRLESTQHNQIAYMRRVTHELKSPLAAISMMLRAVLDGLSGDVPEKQRDMMERALSRSKNALQLTEDLLTLGQLKERLPAEELAQVSISHLIENVVAEEELGAEEQGVEFIVEIEDALPLVAGYSFALTDLVRNLISNAVKYSPDGGHVAVRAYCEHPDVIVEVQDHGIGIAQEDIGRLFDEFYRTAPVRKAGINGTGLGLPIAKSIVERHHGDITVESEPGEGSTFRVTLPVEQDVPSPSEPAPPSTSASEDA